MYKYIIKRLLISVVTLLGITMLVFVLASLVPGSPIEVLLTAVDGNTAEDLARMEAQYGLDKPIYIQYGMWLKELLRGNLGRSYITFRPVGEMIGERIVPTLMLTISAEFLAIIVALFLGTLAAYKPYSAWDYISTSLSVFGAAMPGFFAAIILIYFLGVKWQLLPTSGMYSSGNTNDLADLLRHMILPCVVLSFSQMGVFTRQMRSSMLEVLNNDYIRTARGKGLRENKVLIAHAMRNALMPLVSQIAMTLSALVGGALVVEQVFSWPGIGMLMVASVSSRDYPAIMGITVLIATVVLIGNIVVDIVYSFLDPRISHK